MEDVYGRIFRLPEDVSRSPHVNKPVVKARGEAGVVEFLQLDRKGVRSYRLPIQRSPNSFRHLTYRWNDDDGVLS